MKSAMEREVTLRPANRQDIDRMFQWRNDPDIYQWFREQNSELEWGGHVQWFMNRPEDREDLIIEYMGSPCGVVSLASDGDVGIYIGKKHIWGKGIASRALERALSGRNDEFTAEIHEDNGASQQLFEGVGFERVGKDDGWIQYRFDNPRWEMDNEHGFMQGDGSIHVNRRS